MFFLKKIISSFLLPLTVPIVFLLAGTLLLWTKRQRAGRILVAAGLALLLIFSLPIVPDLLLGPLEGRYPPFDPSSLSQAEKASITHVVVLGGGHVSDPDLPPFACLNDASFKRLAEGIRIHRLLPATRLVLSGGGVFDAVSDAEVMARAAEVLGVPPRDILLESLSRDTTDQAQQLKAVLGDHPFVLVTSASHMPRAMAIFMHAGMRPQAAPTGHLVRTSPVSTPLKWFPAADNIRKSEQAIHEYLGLLWGKWRGFL